MSIDVVYNGPRVPKDRVKKLLWGRAKVANKSSRKAQERARQGAESLLSQARNLLYSICTYHLMPLPPSLQYQWLPHALHLLHLPHHHPHP